MRTVAVLAIAALAAPLSACHRDAAAPPVVARDDAGQLLHRRVWLDEEPKGPADRFHLLVFGDGQHGIYQDRTVWKGAFELFIYDADRGRLTLKLPASRKVVKTSFRIERVKRGEADVRLTIDEPAEGPKVYWGYRFDDSHGADAWVDAKFGALGE